ncbi:MAG: formate-dependent phosphoribosylglycinamide formyltransferase [Pseudomonadota bacterium]
MTNIGTPLTISSTKMLLLGAGELGKEVAIEAQRLGVEVIAVDRYANAPAMQVAHRSYVVDMLDAQALRSIIEQENPAFIVPEIEAIATHLLVELEQQGCHVVPTAQAAHLTMNREGIRRLAAETLDLQTSLYRFAESYDEFVAAVEAIGFPCVVKPVMSSSGKGQTTLRVPEDIDAAWAYSQQGGRSGAGRVIIESFVAFDYEITLLTVKHKEGTKFCAPIGHRQVDGDYRESWQPQPMSEKALHSAQNIAKKITEALGGYGVFGVELFIKGDEAIFSEVSPRPHDTGMVTMMSQDLSEFALHVRAILGLPIPSISQQSPCASHVLLAQGESNEMTYENLDKALAEPGIDLRLFGKPEVRGQRRLGVILARANDIETARRKAEKAAEQITISLK